MSPIADFFPTIGLSALYGGQSKRIGDFVKDSSRKALGGGCQTADNLRGVG